MIGKRNTASILKTIDVKWGVYQGYVGPEMDPKDRQKNYPMCLGTHPSAIADGLKAPAVHQHLFDLTFHCSKYRKLGCRFNKDGFL